MAQPTPPSRLLDVKFDLVPDGMMEILMAELMVCGFDSFREMEHSLAAYIYQNAFDETAIHNIIGKYPILNDMSWKAEPVPEKNWNAEWESHYEPVLIADKCYIRAPFHEPLTTNSAETIIDIVIEPKMSFGTAHHETTALMITWMLETEFTGKRVLDMGCGTGILAILASRLGAKEVVAIDNNRWAYENCLENTEKNSTEPVTVIFGDADSIPNQEFDIVLANINRNTLVEQFPVYAEKMQDAGILCISGFYEDDLPLLKHEADELGLNCVGSRVKNQWMVAKFRK